MLCDASSDMAGSAAAEDLLRTKMEWEGPVFRVKYEKNGGPGRLWSSTDHNLRPLMEWVSDELEQRIALTI